MSSSYLEPADPSDTGDDDLGGSLSHTGWKTWTTPTTKAAIGRQHIMTAYYSSLITQRVRPPVDLGAALNQARIQTDDLDLARKAVTPGFANLYYRTRITYPNQSPGLALSVAAANIDPDAPLGRQIAQLDSASLDDRLGQPLPPQPNPDEGMDWFGWLRPVVRNTVDLLSLPKDYVEAMGRDVFGGIHDGDWGQVAQGIGALGPTAFKGVVDAATGEDSHAPLLQTAAGQTAKRAIIDLSSGQNPMEAFTRAQQVYNQKEQRWEDGWFTDEDSAVGLAQRDEQFRAYQVNGEAWTWGRGAVAALGMDPNTDDYRLRSGIVDAIASIALDPLTYAGGLGLPSKALKGLTGGRVLIGTAKAEAGAALGAANTLAAATGRAEATAATIGEQAAAAEADAAVTRIAATEGGPGQMTVLGVGSGEGQVAPRLGPEPLAASEYLDDHLVTLPAARAAARANMHERLIGSGAPDIHRQQALFEDADHSAWVSHRAGQEPQSLPGLDEADHVVADLNAHLGAETIQTDALGQPVARMIDQDMAHEYTERLDRLRQAPVGNTTAVLTEAGTLGALKRGRQALPTVGLADGAPASIRWVGEKAPNVISADTPLHGDGAQNLFGDLVDALDQVDYHAAGLGTTAKAQRAARAAARTTGEDIHPAAQVVRDMIQAPSLRVVKSKVADMVTDPTTTLGDIHSLLRGIGREPLFAELLRKSGYDGMDMAGPGGARTVWWGMDNPHLVAYTVDGMEDALRAGVPIPDQAPVAYAARIPQTPEAAAAARTAADVAARNLHDASVNAVSEADQMGRQADAALDGFDRAWPDVDITEHSGKSYAEILADPRVQAASRARIKADAGMLPEGGVDKRLTNQLLYGDSLLTRHITKAFINILKTNTDVGHLYRLTGGRFDAETLNLLAANAASNLDDVAKETAVYRIISSRLGQVDPDTGKTAIELGRAGVATAVGALSPTAIRTKLHSAPWLRNLARTAAGATMVRLGDADEVAAAVHTMFLVNRVDDATSSEILGKIIKTAGLGGAEAMHRDLVLDAYRHVIRYEKGEIVGAMADRLAGRAGWGGERGAKRIQDVLQPMLDQAGIWQADGHAVSRYYAEGFGTDSHPAVIELNGKEIPIPKATLDSELASGHVLLPSLLEFRDLSSAAGALLHRNVAVNKVRGLVDTVSNKIWRTAVLVRPAYIWRNVMEMEFRRLLAGESNPVVRFQTGRGSIGRVALSPIRIISHALTDAVDDPGKFRSAVRRVGTEQRYRNTVLGNDFTDLRRDADVKEEMDAYDGLMYVHTSMGDPALHRGAARLGYTPVGRDHPKYNEGIAHQINLLRKSEFAQGMARAMRDGADLDVLMDQFRQGPKYEKARQGLIGSTDQTKFFETVFSSFENTKKFFLDGNEASLVGRISNYTADHPALLDYVAGKPLVHSSGDKVTEINPWLGYQGAQDLDKQVGEVVKKMRRGDTDPWADARFATVMTPIAAPKRTDTINKVTSGFFGISSRFERLGAMGPEYRERYWHEAGDWVDHASQETLQAMLPNAKQTLNPLRNSQGRLLRGASRNHPIVTRIEKAIERGQDGPLSLDQIHAMASNSAAKHVEGLFYDANNKNLAWNSVRLIIPFGQAWANTLVKWGSLAAGRPVRPLHLLQGFSDAQSPDSSKAVYGDLFGMTATTPEQAGEYDPQQGFLYRDGFGDMKFMAPNGTQFSAGGLNLAVGAESVLPGLGPVAQVAWSKLPDGIKANSVAAGMQGVVAPYGETGNLTDLMPGYARSVAAGFGLFGPAGDKTRASQVQAATAYLIQSGGYTEADFADPVKRAKFEAEVEDVTGWMTILRGLGQAILPTGPISQPKGVATNGKAWMGAGLYSALQAEREQHPDDYAAAVSSFLDKYGVAALATIRPPKGAPVATSQAAQFVTDHPDLATAYADDLGAWFPRGDYSDARVRQWLTQFEGPALKPADMTEQVGKLLAQVRMSRAEQKADKAGLSKQGRKEYLDSVRAEFAGSEVPQDYLVQDPSAHVDRFRSMLAHPEFADTEAGRGVQRMLVMRDHYLAEAKAQGFQTLKGKDVSDLQAAYFSDLDNISRMYPDTRAKIFRVFLNEQR